MGAQDLDNTTNQKLFKNRTNKPFLELGGRAVAYPMQGRKEREQSAGGMLFKERQKKLGNENQWDARK